VAVGGVAFSGTAALDNIKESNGLENRIQIVDESLTYFLSLQSKFEEMLDTDEPINVDIF
jgi:hypothetical protein